MTTFRIAVDAHWLVCRPSSGISTYLRGLLAGWAQSARPLQVDLLVPFRPNPTRSDLPDYPGFQLVCSTRRLDPVASYRAQVYWQQVEIPRLVKRQKPDVYLSPFHLTPVTMPGVKVVATIHDLCFMSEPRLSRGRLLHTAQVWTACLRASRLICISHATKKALADWSPTFATKAEVIHNGFESRSLPPAEALNAVRRLDASLMPQQYLLWVGIPCERKNLGLLFEVFKTHRLNFPAHQFVIVSPETCHGQIRESARLAGVADRLRLFSVDNATRDALYHCALAFVFPSSCEGFGYPALEAMAQGCPVVALRGTAMEELLPGSLPLASEPTVDAFNQALAFYLQLTPDEQKKLAEKLIAQAGIFSSCAMAEKTLEILQQSAVPE